MKRVLPLLCCLLVAPLSAAELTLRLPQAEWLLPPLSPPLLQREGLALPAEQDTVQALVAFIGQADHAGALAFLGEDFAPLLALLDSGDPDGQLAQRVVVGGLSQPPRRNQYSAALLYLIGHVYLGAAQPAPAELAFKAALGPLPDYVRVHESLGLLYLRAERFADARRHLGRAAALGLNTADLHGALGYLNHQEHNYWGAVSAYQQAMVLEPDKRQWQQGLLYALSQTYQYDSALTLVEQLLQQQPDDPKLWLFRSQMALQADERQVALTSLETAIRLGEQGIANLQVGATLHMELGSVARAVELLAQGVALGMDYVFVDQAMAWLIQQAHWQYLEQLLAVFDPAGAGLDDLESSRLLTRQASLARYQGAQQAATSALEQALALDPGNADALMALADIHRAQQRYGQAQLLYQRASAYATHRENARLSLAQLAIDQQDFARALQLLRDVLRDNSARTDLVRNIDVLENLVLLRQ